MMGLWTSITIGTSTKMASKTEAGRVKTRSVPYDSTGHIIQRVKIVPTRGHSHFAWYCYTCNELKMVILWRTVVVGGKK